LHVNSSLHLALLVKHKENQMKVIVFGIEDCKWCEKTKVLLDTGNVEYNYHTVPDEEKTQFMDDFVSKFGSDRTFPRVLKVVPEETSFYPEWKLIGGFDQTLDAVIKGEI
jgi:glutaredoxin